ncbi:MAG: HlyD family efflux transporter periplasmic adaptor subunit [Tessaracoccus sp.]|uniref:HlyD family efflux transporter periplasmic adaptor subunit n=1 Tax=Tessaracoccus sp. TaxID=1971211 RepID=UPI001ED5F110|nr:HlyD family efflux transporter periplasmic adaptor subunit [Tessaracoccus sp.]MBK7819498.1 HlyD family efflux transporter periplasmic adaptor subunit [Tessaracoccus sp.]
MTRTVVAGLAVATTLALVGCQQADPGAISATGRVVADALAVQAPALGVSGPMSLGAAQRVAAVEVRLGDPVKEGDVLLRFDDDVLAAHERVAAADVAVAKTQVDVIDAAIDTTREKEDDLRDKREDVTDGIAKAKTARADLVGKRDDARAAAAKLPKQLATVDRNLRDLSAKRSDAERQLAEVMATLDALPAETPAEQRAPLLDAEKKLTAGLKELGTGIAKLKAARGEITKAQAQLKKAIPQLTKGIATVDDKLADAREALKKIDKGVDKLTDARATLKRNRKLAVIAAADTTAVGTASTAREQSVVRAPSDGVVADIAHIGDVVAPGATVARIVRPALVVGTWLAPEQIHDVCVGAPAVVTLDSLAAPVEGRVSRILPVAEYPPSSHATDQVHLTRAVPVEVTVFSALPAGVPADIQLSSCQAKG